MLHGLAEWIAEIVHSLGYLGVALLIALENLFPPIPSELVLPLAGFLVGQERFGFWPVLVAATSGSVGSALLLYGFGALLGEERVYAFVHRWGRYLFVNERDLDRAKGWFDEHGGKAVFIGRLVPGIRSLVSIPAGVVRMPLVSFVLLTALGSGLWNAILISAGRALGERWEQVIPYIKYFEYLTLLVLLGAVLWFVRRRWQSRRNRLLRQM